MGWSRRWTTCRSYQLSIEFREARLTGVVEDKYGIDHDAWEAGFQPFSRIIKPRYTPEDGSMSSEPFQVPCNADVERLLQEEAWSP